MRELGEIQRLSLLLVLAGIGAIYAAETVFEPNTVSLSDIGSGQVGETVTVTANVSSVRKTEAATFMTLREGNETLTGVYFGQSSVPVVENRENTVTGRISLYRGELELIVQTVS